MTSTSESPLGHPPDTPSQEVQSLGIGSAEASSAVLDGVSKSFGSVKAVSELSLEVSPGEFMVLLGPSGCGKSTVLRLVAGLEIPDAGTIRIADTVVNDLSPRDRDVAMVFQSYALYPHLSVRRNIEYPLRAHRVPAGERSRLVDAVSRSLQLDALLDRKPAQLSGGQRQRVALARAIVRRPKVFLMDEPLSNLDAQLRVEMRAELVDLHRRLGITIIYVTHDQIEAVTMGQRIAILRDGILQQLGSPSEVHERPANSFVAGFIGSPPMNILRGKVIASAGEVSVALPSGNVRLGREASRVLRNIGLEEVVVGVRAGDMTVDPEGSLEATVNLVDSLGRERHVTCRLREGQLVTLRLAPTSSAPSPGDEVRLAVRGELHLFDPARGSRIGESSYAPR